jgi:tryptophan synthase alpha chain
MSRIDSIFAELRLRKRTALMPFVTAGYPSLDATARVIPALEKAGASVIELGIPFSDPIADGPVIAQSMHAALSRGVRPTDVLDLVRSVRAKVNAGLVAMVSVSIVMRMGGQRFIEDAAAAGFDGLIVPDIDLHDAEALAKTARSCGVSFSLLVAPTTTPQRVAAIASLCSGFVYLLTRVGITGAADPAPDLADRVAQVRGLTPLPIAAGFGISTAEHIRAATRAADAAIVGSALVQRMGSSGDPVVAAAAFVSELATGLSVR